MVSISGITTREELSQLIAESVAQAIAERREEVARMASDTPDNPQLCVCSEPENRRRHESEHEALRNFIRFLERLENAKWKAWLIVIGLILTAIGYSIFEGAKACLRGG